MVEQGLGRQIGHRAPSRAERDEDAGHPAAARSCDP
jgi:hypothetical protein